MSNLKTFVRRHPALAYYLLVFAISWGGVLLVAVPAGIPATPKAVERWMPFALIALFAGPSGAGVTMTALVDGRAGLRELIARLLRWRVSARWFAAALLPAPILVASVLLALSLVSPEIRPALLGTGDKAALILFGLAWGLAGGGLLEELGWTGFAVPALRRRHGPVATALIVGLLWGAWHVLITFWASGTPSGTLATARFLPAMIFYAASLPAYRVLMVWLHDRTGSLLLAMLMHASFSASMLILQPTEIAGGPAALWNLALAAALWAVVGVIALARAGHLSGQSLGRRRLQEVSS